MKAYKKKLFLNIFFVVIIVSADRYVFVLKLHYALHTQRSYKYISFISATFDEPFVMKHSDC